MTTRLQMSFLTLLLAAANAQAQSFNSYIASPDKIAFFYKDARGETINTLPALGALHPDVRFAMNIQMFSGRHEPYQPVGLYIEDGKQLHKLVRVNNPRVNFGMQPQCVFAITRANEAVLVQLNAVNTADYKYAVELAPMVVINGKVNPKLTTSDSRYVRNGVGLLKDGRVLFAISEGEVTFREFADYFVKQGCVSAAYVDGAVSECWRRGERPTYPGSFAVMVGVR